MIHFGKPTSRNGVLDISRSNYVVPSTGIWVSVISLLGFPEKEVKSVAREPIDLRQTRFLLNKKQEVYLFVSYPLILLLDEHPNIRPFESALRKIGSMWLL
jgi:hypothetical protein